MTNYTLTATKRELTGKQVKTLRAVGLIPATVYGNKVENVNITVKKEDFEKVYRLAKETGLIMMDVSGEKRPVLIQNVDKHPVTREIYNVEFHQVNLKEKVTANIPVHVVGEPEAVKAKLGMLLVVLNEVEIEALPTDLPENIEINVEHLKELNDEVLVKDLVVPSTITILTEGDIMIAKIGSLIVAEAEPVAETAPTAVPTVAETEAAKAEAETPAAE